MQDKDGNVITCCSCEFKKIKDGKRLRPRSNNAAPCKTCDPHTYSEWKFKDWGD